MPTLACEVGLSLLLLLVQKDDDPRFEIPWDKLSEKQQKKVKKVMDDVTVQVPVERTAVSSRAEVYDFLLEELPFTSDVVREMGKGKYEIFRDVKKPEKKAELDAWRHTYYLDDKDGLKLRAELVFTEENRRIFYTWGSYDLDPLPPVWGRSVILVTWAEKDGKLVTDGRVYAQVDSGFYKALSGVFKDTIEGVVKDKSLLFIQAARYVSELLAQDAKKLYTQVKDAKQVDQEVLEELRKRFIK